MPYAPSPSMTSLSSTGESIEQSNSGTVVFSWWLATNASFFLGSRANRKFRVKKVHCQFLVANLTMVWAVEQGAAFGTGCGLTKVWANSFTWELSFSCFCLRFLLFLWFFLSSLECRFFYTLFLQS